VSHLTRLSAATDLPLNADFENGFADEPERVAANVRKALAATHAVADETVRRVARCGGVEHLLPLGIGNLTELAHGVRMVEHPALRASVARRRRRSRLPRPVARMPGRRRRARDTQESRSAASFRPPLLEPAVCTEGVARGEAKSGPLGGTATRRSHRRAPRGPTLHVCVDRKHPSLQLQALIRAANAIFCEAGSPKSNAPLNFVLFSSSSSSTAPWSGTAHGTGELPAFPRPEAVCYRIFPSRSAEAAGMS
jgi:hypothetical protein